MILSLESIAEHDDVFHNDIIADVSVKVEDEAIVNMDLEALAEALRTLPEDERWLISELFLRDKPKTEQEITALTGIPRQTVNYRKNKILKKLKKHLAKN